MTTVNWMWIGNRPQLDSSPNSNITQSQANVAIGWEATGRDEISPIEVTGPSNQESWRPTHQARGWPFPREATDFDYTQPDGDTVNDANVTTFMRASFEIETEDAQGNPITVTKPGVLIQMDNGDVFFRPRDDTLDEWEDIKVIYSIKVVGVTPVSDSTTIAKVGFNASILDVEIPCFTVGTLIRTADGEIPIEQLKAGDLVWTADHGMQALRWIGSSKVNAQTLRAMPNLRPIRIRAGALGDGMPSSDLLVSPQHRVLVRSQIARRMFGCDEILAAAKHLLALDGFEIAEDIAEVEYFHILFDQHAVVQSNGAQTESLYTGPQALKSISAAARTEILTLFPELATADYTAAPARPLTKGREARKLAERHAQNQRALVN